MIYERKQLIVVCNCCSAKQEFTYIGFANTDALPADWTSAEYQHHLCPDCVAVVRQATYPLSRSDK